MQTVQRINFSILLLVPSSDTAFYESAFFKIRNWNLFICRNVCFVPERNIEYINSFNQVYFQIRLKTVFTKVIKSITRICFQLVATSDSRGVGNGNDLLDVGRWGAGAAAGRISPRDRETRAFRFRPIVLPCSYSLEGGHELTIAKCRWGSCNPVFYGNGNGYCIMYHLLTSKCVRGFANSWRIKGMKSRGF